MLYCGIIWATIGGTLLIWAIGRRFFPPVDQDQAPLLTEESLTTGNKHSIHRLKASFAALSRHYLLPEPLHVIFGRTTRLQVLLLVALTGYLTIFSFVGIEYQKWVTPVKNMPGVNNTRTSLGPWSDRIGVLAYALTPLSVMLSSRESLLSIITGVPYQSFNFLHRWLGYIIFIQSALHTIGWCVIEMRLYQPQPEVGIEWIKQTYMIWGVLAMFFLTVLFVLSTPWAIRRTGYEFFRKCHYVMAMLYIGACWGHWAKLECFLIPSLVIWFIDRGARLARTALLHYNYLPNGGMGFRAASATITHFPDPANGDVVRLDFVHPGAPWEVGQHFYLCFPEITVWQSHPFTPYSLPGAKAEGSVHSYILRAKKGATRALADLAAAKTIASPNDKKTRAASAATASVLLTGPYGRSIRDHLTQDTNVLCIAGGTGVTFVLPVLLRLITQRPASDRKLELVWAVRRDADLSWARQELDQLRRSAVSHGMQLRIFVTREGRPDPGTHGLKQLEALDTPPQDDSIQASSASVSSSSSSSRRVKKDKEAIRVDTLSIHHPTVTDSELHLRRPDLGMIVHDFLDTTIRGSTTVYASGPGGMVSDLRRIVAGCNSGGEVWKGKERYDVRLVCDDRMEW
jgi:ferric-chelate reductase